MAEQPGPQMSAIRRAGLIALLGMAVGLLSASPAGAASTMTGTCTFGGSLAFDPPIGNELRELSYRDRASGTCTGTLNGVPQQDAPAVIRASGSGIASCLAGRTTSSGTLTFTRGTKREADDVKIRFFTSLAGVLTEYTGTFHGAVSGEGTGLVNLLPDESGLAECEAGTLDFLRYDLVARTITPVVG
jgi:hypothetical protein